MNNQTTELLEKLADKLGTTTEYLWSILLKQAPIDATTTLIQILFIMICGVALYKSHKYFSNDDNDISYYGRDEIIPVMVGFTFIWALLAIACFFCISDVINGYFNPEYWALQKILEHLN